MVNNKVFFQHPDLIRILRVHKNVMDVMMNTLGRRAQTQSDIQIAAASSPGQAVEEMKEKVTSCVAYRKKYVIIWIYLKTYIFVVCRIPHMKWW